MNISLGLVNQVFIESISYKAFNSYLLSFSFSFVAIFGFFLLRIFSMYQFCNKLKTCLISNLCLICSLQETNKSQHFNVKIL